LPESMAKNWTVKFSRQTRQGPAKIEGAKAVNAVPAPSARLIDQAGVATVTEIAVAVPTIARTQTVSTTTKVEAAVATAREVEGGVASTQVVDRVGADVPIDPRAGELTTKAQNGIPGLGRERRAGIYHSPYASWPPRQPSVDPPRRGTTNHECWRSETAQSPCLKEGPGGLLPVRVGESLHLVVTPGPSGLRINSAQALVATTGDVSRSLS
jgi:hypothetical protein